MIRNALISIGFGNVIMNKNGFDVCQFLETKKANYQKVVLFYNLNTHEYDGLKLLNWLNEKAQMDIVDLVFISNPLSLGDENALLDLGTKAILYKPIQKKGIHNILEKLELS